MKFYKDSRFIVGLYTLIGLIAGIQRYILGPDRYNNFVIFQHSIYHFFDHLNPYLDYSNEYSDVFLYNPSFIVLFMPFALIPTLVGLILWPTFTLVVYYFGVNTLPFSQQSKVFLFYLIIPEILTSVANLQTNPLIVAFTILSVTLLEKEAYQKAAIFPSLNFFIKGYGAVAGAFFLLKNPRIKTFAYLGLFFLLLGASPLLFYSWSEFVTLYEQWFVSLKEDYSINTGLSAMGVIKSLLCEDASIPMIQMVGIVSFLVTFTLLLYRKNYDLVKFHFLAYVLLWMVIFNQAAESPTYIIASTGGFIWYLTSHKTWLDKALFMLFFLITVLATSDFCPNYIRNTFVNPYSLKALPCMLIWLRIQWDLLRTTTQSLDVIYGE